MIAGWREPVAGVCRAAGRALPGIRSPPPAWMAASDRAMLYAVAAHVLDFDDTALCGHPSAVLVPAILAQAQESGADGKP